MELTILCPVLMKSELIHVDAKWATPSTEENESAKVISILIAQLRDFSL